MVGRREAVAFFIKKERPCPPEAPSSAAEKHRCRRPRRPGRTASRRRRMRHPLLELLPFRRGSSSPFPSVPFSWQRSPKYVFSATTGENYGIMIFFCTIYGVSEKYFFRFDMVSPCYIALFFTYFFQKRKKFFFFDFFLSWLNDFH